MPQVGDFGELDQGFTTPTGEPAGIVACRNQDGSARWVADVLQSQMQVVSCRQLVCGGFTIEKQTRQRLTNVAGILEEAGSSMDGVVSGTMVLVDGDDFAGMNRAYVRWFLTDFLARKRAKLPAELRVSRFRWRPSRKPDPQQSSTSQQRCDASMAIFEHHSLCEVT